MAWSLLQWKSSGVPTCLFPATYSQITGIQCHATFREDLKKFENAHKHRFMSNEPSGMYRPPSTGWQLLPPALHSSSFQEEESKEIQVQDS